MAKRGPVPGSRSASARATIFSAACRETCGRSRRFPSRRSAAVGTRKARAVRVCADLEARDPALGLKIGRSRPVVVAEVPRETAELPRRRVRAPKPEVSVEQRPKVWVEDDVVLEEAATVRGAAASRARDHGEVAEPEVARRPAAARRSRIGEGEVGKAPRQGGRRARIFVEGVIRSDLLELLGEAREAQGRITPGEHEVIRTVTPRPAVRTVSWGRCCDDDKKDDPPHGEMSCLSPTSRCASTRPRGGAKGEVRFSRIFLR